MSKKIILTVCRGNIARSPFAEAIILQELKKRNLEKEYVSVSRGVQGTSLDPAPVKFPNITYYEDLYKETKPILDKFDVDLSNHISRRVDFEIVKQATIILAVDQKTKAALIELFPAEKSKIYLLSELVNRNSDISDPEGISGEQKQAKTFTEMRTMILDGFDKLLLLSNDRGQ